eukprot:CAMPEP_0179416696 /NCGR_PEP_ID=MMETSP0799-20121207/6940_1 /TAXON_ID=46947 /ORGANISM="Geminigera cryophila, Strain CCMP2564" /LENGTH=53 /DNA_ID=CAMNT_0021189593 /DNA_START=271 /DNA_END=432 /DNA_ORIENTATION=+
MSSGHDGAATKAPAKHWQREFAAAGMKARACVCMCARAHARVQLVMPLAKKRM